MPAVAGAALSAIAAAAAVAARRAARARGAPSLAFWAETGAVAAAAVAYVAFLAPTLIRSARSYPDQPVFQLGCDRYTYLPDLFVLTPLLAVLA